MAKKEKSANANMHSAKKEKNDEFYTQLSDIESEIIHYRAHFKDKVVYCNCDDPEQSMFWLCLRMQFNVLGLKKLISTHYSPNKIFNSEPAYKLELDEFDYIIDEDGELLPTKANKTFLKGDGDFRSDECVEILKEADIIVTNPPFSLFREYVSLLVEHDKKFLIIGNQNAITYKEIFPRIKDNKMWLGVSTNKTMEFILPKTAKKWSTIDVNGNKKGKVPAISWFTNLTHKIRNEELVLWNTYYNHDGSKRTDIFPKYDNYDAINIDKVVDIPKDYEGYMGVPITFLNKYNPDQFEILGLGISSSGTEIGVRAYKPEHKKYRNEIQKRAAVNGDLYMLTDGKVDVPYARILIKNKKVEKNENN